MSDDATKQNDSILQEARGLAGQLRRLAVQRAREFSREARAEILATLREARQALEDEGASGPEPPPAAAPAAVAEPPAPPEGGEADPAGGRGV